MEPVRDALLSDDARLLIESVGEFRTRVIDDIAREMDEFPESGKIEEAWKAAEPLGLHSALPGEGSGGQGMDAYSFCLVLEEIARGSAGFSALLLSHNLAVWVLERCGVLDKGGCDGRAALAWPFDRHSGEARLTLGGRGAEVIVLPSGDDERLFRISPGNRGVSIEALPSSMGLRAARPAFLRVNGVDEPAVSCGIGQDILEELEYRLLLGMAAVSLGITRSAFEKAYAYALERYQGGDIIINHGAIRLMLSRMLAGMEGSEAALLQARDAAGEDGLRLAASRVAKVLAADNAMQAALDGVQIHGGYGYMRDYGMERLMRDAKYCQVYPRPPQEELLGLLDRRRRS